MPAMTHQNHFRGLIFFAAGWMLFSGDASTALCQSVADQATAPAESEAEVDVETTLKNLAEQDYATRQRATIEMWRHRDQSRDAVQQAARDADPEIAGRARWILRQWRRGALPNTPPEISRLLQSSDQPAAIERLMEAGEFAAAVVSVEESAGTIDRELISRRVNLALVRRFPIYVRTALQSESMDQLIALLDLVAETSQAAVCRIELMQLCDIPVTDDILLPRSAETWPAATRDRVTAMLLTKLDRYDDAIAMAKQSGDEGLWLGCLAIASRWQEIADFQVAKARASEPGSLDHVKSWCHTLAAADRCGDAAMVDEAVSQLVAPETCGIELAIDLRWKYLASHGHVDHAISICGSPRLSQKSKATIPLGGDANRQAVHAEIAAALAIDSSRVADAFEALQFPLDRIDLDYAKWVDQALDDQAVDVSMELGGEIRRVLVLVQCLLAIGRDDVAWSICKRLCDSNLEIGVQAKHPMAEYVISMLAMTKREDWIRLFAIDPVNQSVSPQSLYVVARTLPDTSSQTIEVVDHVLTKLFPTRSPRELFLDTCKLLEGELPDGFDPDVDFQRFHDEVVSPVPSRGDLQRIQMNRALGRAGVGREDLAGIAIPANAEIVEMFLRHGQTDLAAGCLAKIAESGNPDAYFQLGQQAFDSGRVDMAQQYFDALYATVRKRTRGGSDDAAMAGKAMIASWLIARRRGDDQATATLLRELRLVMCSPSSRTRLVLAETLRDADQNDLALEAFRGLVSISLFGDTDTIDVYEATRGYALAAQKTEPDQAARWFDLAVLRSIESDGFRPGAFVTLPMYVHRWSLQSAIERGDADAAKQHLDRLMQLDPLDIDLAERLLPEAREASMESIADEAFDQIMRSGLAYCETFAFDAMSHNNLAWVAAMNKRNLDEALALSKRAVTLEPDSAIYRDTLAEILFLRGDADQALQIEQACVLDDPGQWHLHQQIDRFSKPVTQD